jgi:hypothetical protein
MHNSRWTRREFFRTAALATGAIAGDLVFNKENTAVAAQLESDSRSGDVLFSRITLRVNGQDR